MTCALGFSVIFKCVFIKGSIVEQLPLIFFNPMAALHITVYLYDKLCALKPDCICAKEPSRNVKSA